MGEDVHTSAIPSSTKTERLTPGLVSAKRLQQHEQRLLRSFSGRRQRWVTSLFLAAVTFGSGVLNLVSVMGGPSHPKFLTTVFPLEFIHLSRNLTLLIGFALVLSSLNIYRRKRRAWSIVLALSSFSIIFHLTRGLDYEEASFSFVLVLLLLLARNTFTVKSSAPHLISGFVRLLLAGAVALGYGIAGFWFLDERHFGINFHIGDAILTTLKLLSLSGDPRLAPHTGYGHWFLDSLYLISLTALVYAGLALFRPVVYRFAIFPRERALTREIVARHTRTTLDYFKLWPDKSYFFSPSHRCFIAYRVAGSVALALGDPVGPEEEVEATVREFLEMCAENDWTVGFHQTLPNFLDLYRSAGLHKLKIGDDALISLPGFSLDGKKMKEFRYKIRQLESVGVHIVEYQPPVPEHIIAQLKTVSDEWLQIPGRRERTFTLGQFDPEYLRSTPIMAAADHDGNLLAFVNFISTSTEEITCDLMRRRTDAPNGIMDYLFVKVFLHARDAGYKSFDLGMAPMAGFQEREEATAEERAIHTLFQQLNFLFSFQGLRHYKAKFATSWEPRYLIYRNVMDLPRVALALRRVSEVRDEALL